MKMQRAFNAWRIFLMLLLASSPLMLQAQDDCSYCIIQKDCSKNGNSILFNTCAVSRVGSGVVCGTYLNKRIMNAAKRDMGWDIDESLNRTTYSGVFCGQRGWLWERSPMVNLPSLNSPDILGEPSTPREKPGAANGNSEHYLADLKMVCATEIEAFVAVSQQKTGTTREQAMVAVENFMGESRQGLNNILKMAASGKYPATATSIFNCLANRRLAQLDGKVPIASAAKPTTAANKKKSGANMTSCVGIVEDKSGAKHTFNKCDEPIEVTYCHKQPKQGASPLFQCRKEKNGNWNKGSHSLAPGATGSLADMRSFGRVEYFACKKGEIPSITGWAKNGKPLGRCRP